MLDEEQVRELLKNIQKALEEFDPDVEHFKTVYESQIYVLQKILQ